VQSRVASCLLVASLLAFCIAALVWSRRGREPSQEFSAACRMIDAGDSASLALALARNPAFVHERISHSGRTILHTATESWASSHSAARCQRNEGGSPACQLPQTILLLLDFGAEVNAVDDDGDTALHLASAGQCTSLMRILVRRGADPNVENSRGFTPAALCLSPLAGRSVTFWTLEPDSDAVGARQRWVEAYGSSWEVAPARVTTNIRILLGAGARARWHSRFGASLLDIARLFEAPDDVTQMLVRSGAATSWPATTSIFGALSLAAGYVAEHSDYQLGLVSVQFAGDRWHVITNSAAAGTNIYIDIDARTGQVLRASHNPM